MTNSLRIPLDPLNPGQFYACCGLVEVLDLLGGGVESHFELNRRMPRFGEFIIRGPDGLDLNAALAFVREADYEPQEVTEASVQPILVKSERLARPFMLDWWLNEYQERATSLKCWAGQVTSAGLFRELPRLIDTTSTPEGLFRQTCQTSSRFGVDPRSSWNALDFGSSPNTQKREAATFAAVEMLAAFGLQGFRPILESRDRVTYEAWLEPLPRSVARTVAARRLQGISSFTYCFRIAKRGQSYKFFTFAEPDIERNDLV